MSMNIQSYAVELYNTDRCRVAEYSYPDLNESLRAAEERCRGGEDGCDVIVGNQYGVRVLWLRQDGGQVIRLGE